jgi:hypothetical protein
LTPLKIEKGGDLDKQIKKSYSKHELESKKKFSYMVKSGSTYLREIHLGKKLGKSAVRFVSDLVKILRSSAKPESKEESSKDE